MLVDCAEWRTVGVLSKEEGKVRSFSWVSPLSQARRHRVFRSSSPLPRLLSIHSSSRRALVVARRTLSSRRNVASLLVLVAEIALSRQVVLLTPPLADELC